MKDAISTNDLTCRFGSVTAVDGLNLKVPTGSVFGFLGPNGAGKTTTIRMLLGLIKPYRGQVRLNGFDVSSQRAQAAGSIGAIVETPGLYGNLTGYENLRLATMTHGGTKSEIASLVSLVELTHAIDRRVAKYSLGMRQRLAVARALLGRPKLLILDEPTNGLDPAGIAEFRQLIRKLPEVFGTTVFLSSHLLGEIEQTASHCALLKSGRLLFQGTMAQLHEHVGHAVAVSTRQTHKVAAFADQNGWRYQINEDAILLQEAFSDQELSELLANLVHASCEITEFHKVRPSLERVFFEMTEAAE